MLLFHDINDELVPYESSQNLVKIWKEAKLVTTQGLGHRRLLWNSDVHQQIVNFFAKDSQKKEK
jgi:pimeloyl-ACP methyl ester carboxylesterase